MADRPRGTVNFLFTDIEGSTRLWQDHPQAMPAAYARHDAVLRQAVAAALASTSPAADGASPEQRLAG